MNPPESLIFEWPQPPPLPPLNQAVLIRVATSSARKIARQELRIVLRQTLTEWSGILPEQLPLEETPRGPKWRGELAGHPVDISLTYSEDEGWIGLLRGGAIGIDMMLVKPIVEAEEVARHYLGPEVLADIQYSKNPARAFALAWTSLEARLKCLRLNLAEWSKIQNAVRQNQVTQSIVADTCRIVTVATIFCG